MRKRKLRADTSLSMALDLWKATCSSHVPSVDEAKEFHRKLLEQHHESASCWTSLACGRASLISGDLQIAEYFLREAAGRFHMADDSYGQGLVDCHIGMVLSARGQFERALKFINRPLNSGVVYAGLDKALLHSAAAHLHWLRQDYHLAVAHLLNEVSALRTSGSNSRYCVTLANLGVLLLQLNELELSLLASQQAWEWQVINSTRATELQLSALGNITVACLYLGRLGEAARYAELLWERLNAPSARQSTTLWMIMTEVFGALHDAGRAAAALSNAKVLSPRAGSPVEKVNLSLSEASLHEANMQFELAIQVARSVLEAHGDLVNASGHIGAALLCSRSYAALSDESESRRWAQLANKNSQRELLDRMLISQLRATLIEDQAVGVLTVQELNCLNLSARGQSSADIGLKLGIKPRTVNFHFSKIFRKLNATNRQEAIAKAMRANLLSPREPI